MTLTYDSAAFAKAVATVSAQIDRKAILPITNNLLLSHDGETTTLTGTNLDSWTTAKIPAEGEAISTTIPAHDLSAFLAKTSKAETVTIDANDEGILKITVRAGRFRISFLTLPAADFPRGPIPDWQMSFTVDRTTAHNLLVTPLHAASKEEARWLLQGVHLHARETLLQSVALDQKRLFLWEATAPCDEEATAWLEEQGDTIIVPSKFVELLAKQLADGSDDPVTLNLSNRMVQADLGATCIQSKLIEGAYPDYPRVIPQPSTETGTRVTIPAKDIVESLDVAGVGMAADSVLALEVKDDVMWIEGRNKDTHTDSTTTIDAIAISGGNTRVGLMPKHIAQAVRALSPKLADDILIDITGTTTGIRLTNTTNDSAVAVVSPCRV